jgi:hypothetical protein
VLVVERLGRDHFAIVRVKAVQFVVQVGYFQVCLGGELDLAVSALGLAQVAILHHQTVQFNGAKVKEEAQKGEGERQDAEEDLRFRKRRCDEDMPSLLLERPLAARKRFPPALVPVR